MSKLTGEEATVPELQANGRTGREAPLTPERFHGLLREGMEKGDVTFTNKGDVDLVAKIHARGFEQALSEADTLSLYGMSWTDESAKDLAKAFLYIRHNEDTSCQVERMSLENNNIGDEGAIALADAFSENTCPNLRQITLASNRIGDAGLLYFVDAISRGALPQLRGLWLNNNAASSEAIEAARRKLSSLKLDSLVLQ